MGPDGKSLQEKKGNLCPDILLTQISGQGFGTMTVNSGIIIPSPAATVALFTLKGERRLLSTHPPTPGS